MAKQSTSSKKSVSPEPRQEAASSDGNEAIVPRLRVLYDQEIRTKMRERFEYKNVMQIPKLTKVVLNMGVGDAVNDRKLLTSAVEQMRMIAGQQPVTTKARRSIAGFKIRQNFPVGCKVTLRDKRMYEFIDRLVNIALPRVRDFRGLSPDCFDGNGNFAFGLHEQIVFPEVDFDQIDRIRGLDICVCTSASTNEEAHALLAHFNFPFSKK